MYCLFILIVAHSLNGIGILNGYYVHLTVNGCAEVQLTLWRSIYFLKMPICLKWHLYQYLPKGIYNKKATPSAAFHYLES